MLSFRELFAPGPVTFAARGVQPPGNLYLSESDQLAIASASSASSPAVTLRARILRPNGHVVPLTFNHQPASDRSLRTETFNVGEGFLLGLAVTPDAAGIQRGQTFISLYVTRGELANAVIVHTLAQDYVTSDRQMGWPGGPIKASSEGNGFLRNLTGTDPAPGNPILEAVPTSALWKVHGGYFNFITDATVVNRQILARYFAPGGGLIYEAAAPAVQAAGQTVRYILGGWVYSSAPLAPAMYIPMPGDFPLYGAYSVRVYAVNQTAGDDFTQLNLSVEEWIA